MKGMSDLCISGCHFVRSGKWKACRTCVFPAVNKGGTFQATASFQDSDISGSKKKKKNSNGFEMQFEWDFSPLRIQTLAWSYLCCELIRSGRWKACWTYVILSRSVKVPQVIGNQRRLWGVFLAALAIAREIVHTLVGLFCIGLVAAEALCKQGT